MSNGMVFTGEGVTLYQLSAARSAIKLEKIGMKHSSGRSVRKHWALQLGLKANAKADEVIETLTKKIDGIKANLKPEEVQTF